MTELDAVPNRRTFSSTEHKTGLKHHTLVNSDIIYNLTQVQTNFQSVFHQVQVQVFFWSFQSYTAGTVHSEMTTFLQDHAVTYTSTLTT